jgi:DNA replicative helicase MCM subunit Mcm2 (Cdc46/Mcm family)
VEVSNGVFVQPDPLLHGSRDEGFVTLEFLKKYIGYAKQIRPARSEGARAEIVQAWAELRTIEGRKSLPLTPRAFETLIRLATAHAKIRLADVVAEEDARAAIRLLRFAIFGESEKPAQKAGRGNKRAQPKPKSESSSSESGEETGETEEQSAPVEDAQETEKRIERVIEVFQMLLRDPLVTTVKVSDLADRVEKEKGFRPSETELASFLDRLIKADKIMLDEDIIYPL